MDIQQIGEILILQLRRLKGTMVRNILAVYLKRFFDNSRNGFKIIETLEAGVSPLSAIYQRDSEYEN